MKIRRLLVFSLAASSLVACFDFDGAYGSYCDGGRCAQGGGGTGGTGGGTGGGGNEDAGGDDGGLDGGLDAGDTDAGDDAGTTDAGSDAGTPDAGCGGAVQLAIVSPVQTLEPLACSAPVKVQLQDRCGAPVIATQDVSLGFSASSVSLQLFSESSCTTTQVDWLIASGTSELDVFVNDSAPGMPTLQVSSGGLDGGAQTFTIACPAGWRPCAGTCIPAAGCCGDPECVSGTLPRVCNSNNVCAPPPCTGFPANCSTWDDRTAPAASRTITFSSSGYTPKCMRVTTTQDVTFSGSFFIHPLEQTCGPSDRQMTTTSGTTRTLRFPSFGTYGYRCASHPSFEEGAIRVP